ncbi:general secretion pathway protein GspC [Archangium violaceum]|uniref:type II secretion system protein GspC n=1 Tax=Archangium violaceum TaxID=83451 RepID=UPI00193B198D|nr:type II secretion system protein GspC [Archangium violaceum]QRK04033.1 general secretion pathway protein GspC [Archangium violaceum]
MSTLIRPTFHALTLLCAACTCLVAAHAVNSVVDAWLQPLPSFPEETPKKARSTQEMATPLALAPLARYLGLPDKLREEVRVTLPSEHGDGAVPNTLGLKLLGTMLGATPSTTFASVYEGPTRRTRSVWMGGDIQGAQVVAIERARVLLMNAGQMEYVEPTATDAAPQLQEPREPRASSLDVRQISPRNYEVSRKDLDATLANPNEVMMQARLVPAFRDGEPQGFKMFAIKPSSIYNQLGLQNGDVLKRINGHSLQSPDRALEAYQALREASRIELEVERNGQPLQLTYSVR